MSDLGLIAILLRGELACKCGYQVPLGLTFHALHLISFKTYETYTKNLATTLLNADTHAQTRYTLVSAHESNGFVGYGIFTHGVGA
jgi:hypothetical protein